MTDLATVATMIRRAAGELSAEQLPDFVAAIEAARALAWVRLSTPIAPNPDASSTLVNAAELARRLNVAETWVRTAARRGKIPAVSCGVHIRFDPIEVLAAMKAGKAALADRGKLSERGRKAVGHRIREPVRQNKRSKSSGLAASATALLPQSDAAEGAERA